MQTPPKLPLVIEPWTKDHDASQFTSDLASIKKYIQEQAHRHVASYTSSVFVLTEPGDKVISGYYSLSSLRIVFNELPTKVQKKLPRYPEATGILLGRLGVDRDYSKKTAGGFRREAPAKGATFSQRPDPLPQKLQRCGQRTSCN